MTDTIRPPSLLWTALEGVRATLSAAQLLSHRQYLKQLPQGDGHTILVLPGFMAGDYSTIGIRYFLKQWGYQASGWNLGMNTGLNKRRDLEKLMRKELHTLFKASGQKVSIVGWSLGGVYARELARENPDMVRCVITLGSPIGGAPEGTITGGLYELITRTNFNDSAFKDKIERAKAPVPDIPCTAIFSKTDGIVHWKIAIEKESASAENIEVETAHCGYGLDPAVMYALADRLQQTQQYWKKFDKLNVARYQYR